MMPPDLAITGYLLLEVAAFFGLCMQIVQTAMTASMRPKGRRKLAVVAGACTIAHLALAADAVTVLDWQHSPVLASAIAAQGIAPLLWANLALAAIVAVLAHLGRDRLLWIAAALMLSVTPPLANALGAWWNLVAVLDICGLLAVGAAQLYRIFEVRYAQPTYASIAEAMNVISVGMLVTDGHGGSVFMNDAMRSQLELLGFPTDLGNLTHVWEGVQEYAVTPAGLGLKDGAFPPPSPDANQEQTLVNVGDGRTLSVLVERPHDGTRGTRVFAIDVTRIVDAARRLSSANAALEQANAELTERLDDVRAIARQAAFLRMRASVHDVIGQRLSILQRYLDAGKVDEQSVAKLRGLMDSILHDLREASGGNPVEHLEDVVDAFALVDVQVVVEGDLPNDQAVSNALVNIVREASTNACRHAQARTVWVTIGREEREGGQWATIEIRDDGLPPDADGEEKAPGEQKRATIGVHDVAVPPDAEGWGSTAADGALREGTGIPSMRQAVEELGGAFSVRPRPVFTVSAQVPLRQGEDANARAR